jgi:hypothetical protein
MKKRDSLISVTFLNWYLLPLDSEAFQLYSAAESDMLSRQISSLFSEVVS